MENLRDLAEADGRELLVSLVLNDDELNLVARSQLDAVVHLRHVEEQLLALHSLVVQEAKLKKHKHVQALVQNLIKMHLR